jgi:hypothetical protein
MADKMLVNDGAVVVAVDFIILKSAKLSFKNIKMLTSCIDKTLYKKVIEKVRLIKWYSYNKTCGSML